MKKHVLLLSFLALPMLLLAQAERMVFIEQFTNASCVPCDAQNPAFNALLFDNTTKVVFLKYQTSFPGFDPMNAQNPVEVLNRRQYYGITGVPTATIDGTLPNDSYGGGVGEWDIAGGGYAGGPYGYNNAVIDYAHNQSTPLEMELTHRLSPDLDSMFIEGKIRNVSTDTFDAANTFLRVAIIEEEILFPEPPGSTEEVDFYHVMRKMLPDENGTALDDLPAGDSLEFSFSVPLPGYVYNYAQISAVAFVQTDGSRQVHQSAISENLGVPDAAVDLAFTVNAQKEDGYCEYGVTPSMEVTNAFDRDVTRFEADVLLNGEVQETVVFENDTLSEGESTSIVFQMFDVEPGTSNISFQIREPNGFLDFNRLNELDNSSIQSTLPDEPFGNAFAEGFETTGIGDDPDNALIETPSPLLFSVVDNNFFDVSGSVGGYAESSKSLWTNFYQWDDVGAQANLVYGKVDLTDRQDAMITFDYSFVQYIGFATNDRLIISVSEDCGETWTTVFDEGGASWATGPAQEPFFIPSSASQWETDTVDLSAYDGTAELNIRFTVQTDWGNNLYLDNIVLSSDMATSVTDLSQLDDQLFVYPNPAGQQVNIDFSLRESRRVHAAIFDASGRAVHTLLDEVELGAGGHRLQWQPESGGVYFLRVATEDGLVSRRVIVRQ